MRFNKSVAETSTQKTTSQYKSLGNDKEDYNNNNAGAYNGQLLAVTSLLTSLTSLKKKK